MPGERGARDREVFAGLSVLGTEAKGPLKIRHRFSDVALLSKCAAQVVARVCVVGFQLQSFSQKSHGDLRFPLGSKQSSLRAQGFGKMGARAPIIRIDLQHFAKVRGCLVKDSAGDLRAAVATAYARTLSRKPSPAELDYALTYIGNDPSRLKELAWLLFNLDEFIYIR